MTGHTPVPLVADSITNMAAERQWHQRTLAGAAVAEQLDCSPSTKMNRVLSAAGTLPVFRMWESCRTMQLVGGFSRGSPVSHTLAIPGVGGTPDKYLVCPELALSLVAIVKSLHLAQEAIPNTWLVTFSMSFDIKYWFLHCGVVFMTRLSQAHPPRKSDLNNPRHSPATERCSAVVTHQTRIRKGPRSIPGPAIQIPECRWLFDTSDGVMFEAGQRRIYEVVGNLRASGRARLRLSPRRGAASSRVRALAEEGTRCVGGNRNRRLRPSATTAVRPEHGCCPAGAAMTRLPANAPSTMRGRVKKNCYGTRKRHKRIGCSRRFSFDSRRGRFRISACGNRAGRCRWSTGFLMELPPFHSGAAPSSTRFILIGSLDLDKYLQPADYTAKDAKQSGWRLPADVQTHGMVLNHLSTEWGVKIGQGSELRDVAVCGRPAGRDVYLLPWAANEADTDPWPIHLIPDDCFYLARQVQGVVTIHRVLPVIIVEVTWHIFQELLNYFLQENHMCYLLDGVEGDAAARRCSQDYVTDDAELVPMQTTAVQPPIKCVVTWRANRHNTGSVEFLR
ncbi:hypothetical protein PR048_015785 [Dryococelus australis]|uniref:Uncharacterized protein n=1 Tax=Dryococelus australis TaxID=614101 RepID=A0ABQ9HI84_9NEOP|nr:hypothetical protein PR048_015785 [Dryococelus australis]